jgi:riboflavin kinase/FMN adenylyltransferase
MDETGRGNALARGILNLGVRPTVAAGFSVEAHLFDFEGDLYGAKLRVHLISRIRDERKFPSLDALKSQIGADVELSRRLLEPRAEPKPGGAWA